MGLDKERDLYFRNSRALLSDSDQSNAFETLEKTAKELKFVKIPRNIAAIKSMAIYKQDEQSVAHKCKFLMLLDNTRFGDRFSGFKSQSDGSDSADAEADKH